MKGIGPKTKKELLVAFKSVKRLREASEEEVSAVVGPAKARLLKEHFQVEKE